WVRLVDVPRALAQRHYARPVDLVIEVTDELCQQNQGRWRLTAASAASPGPGFAATCERTTAPADLALPVRALGAVYLGGTRFGPWVAAGLVPEITPVFVAALSAATFWDRAPWCPMIFCPPPAAPVPVIATRAAPPRRGRPGSTAACW